MTCCNPISILMEPGTKLSKFDGGERVDANKYQSLVGSLRYLTCSRPDLSLSVGVKLVHRGANLLTLEGIKASFTIHPRYCVTGVVLFKSSKLQVDWLL